jgi:hypothetical protein
MSPFFKLAAGFRQMSAVLGIMVVMLAAQGAVAVAGDCAVSRGNPETARLQRQIAANRTFETKYGCSAASSFACREIAGRIAQASTRLASLTLAPSCRPAVADRAPSRRTVAATRGLATGDAVPRVSARMETRCVRLSDGYSFPTPNSGYNTADDIEAISAQCKFICDDPGMDVYRMTSEDRNTDEMISVTTGARYAQLPKARAYRRAASLKTCDINRFYKTVLAKMPQAAAAPASNGQDVQPVEAINLVLLGDVGLRGSTSFVTPQARKVRMVGAAYLPEN